MTEPTPTLPLFAKLHKVNYLFDRISNQELQTRLSLTLAQYRILIGVQAGPHKQIDIARYWNISEAAISRQVEAMVQQGLVTREPNPVSRREHLLNATARGRRAFQAATTLLDDLFVQIERHLGDDTAVFERSIDTLLRHLREQTT